ncbi:D-alanyl-D-alanine carboxypeptidase/D-alanyl-D-alanine endopeptidase [Candidatus Entotheonella palauensis]|uniref:D-alanyl-D-alanine carboxypeptidase n=1 Tax=Candidatus Entotheonella gemina TaxID=1429439 RepID=W4LT25_9BACT|nr:D-alanyl-D-alanine carboxypeptidase/D-alanyl-D-alanine-endopeptidase [Candidatus Entotheonella palauensis]ETX01204.1 MAG: hypothetical protein ETSY2_37670 [Candidatus Entotheonella gemina]
MPWIVLWVVMGLLVRSVYAEVPASLRTLLPPGTQVSLIVQSIHAAEPLYAWQPDMLRMPASALKLLTALGATLYLGHDFRFETRLMIAKGTRHSGTIRGDLIMQFVGDPSLTRGDLRNLFAQLRAQGISRVTGDVVLDISAFNGYDRGRGWSWDDLGICYTAPASAIVVDHNCIKGYLDIGVAGQGSARVRLSTPQAITVSSQVNVLTRHASEHEQRFCDLELERLANNHYHLTGCVMQRRHRLPLAFAITDPKTYALAMIRDELQATGIHLDGRLRFHQQPMENMQVLVRHKSLALATFLQDMLKKSDNLSSEILLKTLGRTYFRQPGSYRNGTEALKSILMTRAQIDLKHSYLADGSGLSRYNLLTARQLLEVLIYIYRHDNALRLLQHLPIAGVDGTLQRRRSLRHLKGKVMAKTGTIKQVSSLAGFLTTAQGRKLAFVLLINGYLPTDDTPMQLKNQRTSPLEQFEYELFTHLFQENIMP